MYCVATKWQQKNRIAYALPIIQIMKILSAKSHKQMCLRLVYRERALSVPARMYSRLRLFIESKIFRSNRPCFAPLCRYIDPMMVIRRTHDTVRYIRWEWNKEHADPIDEEELRLFLCDEHYGDLTDEQRAVARRCRDEMRDVYAEMCVRLLQSGIMLERGMVPDVSTYRSVFYPEGGDAPWMLDQAG